MPTAVERAILEYVIETGYLVVRLVKLAEQVLAGSPPLSNQEEASFRQDIAEKWFHLECDQCNSPVAIEDIPVAIESGVALCPRCRHPVVDMWAWQTPAQSCQGTRKEPDATPASDRLGILAFRCVRC
jgi:hypothetical protein